MTWYAGQIIAEPSGPMIAVLSQVEALRDHLFLIRDVDDHQFPNTSTRHTIPGQGLLVVRELCESGSHDALWHGEVAVDWSCLVGPETARIITSVEISSRGGPDFEYPPEGLLRFLESASRATGSIIGFYSCFMWGGDTEQEYAWIFGDNPVVYTFQDDETAMEFRGRAQGRSIPGQVLMLAMSHFGLSLPTPYFAPFTRAFPWEPRKLAVPGNPI